MATYCIYGRYQGSSCQRGRLEHSDKFIFGCGKFSALFSLTTVTTAGDGLSMARNGVMAVLTYQTTLGLVVGNPLANPKGAGAKTLRN